MKKSWQIFLSHKINLRSSEDLSDITQQLFPYMQDYSPYSPVSALFMTLHFLYTTLTHVSIHVHTSHTQLGMSQHTQKILKET